MRSRGFLCVASRRPDQPRPYSVQRALEGLRPCLVRPRRAGARSNRAPADFPCPRTPPSTKAYAGQPPASLPMDLSDAPELPAPEIKIVAVFPTAGKSCLLPRLTCSGTTHLVFLIQKD
ncbi:uncharacterized protein [Triticum aestivum]|uniref:uncharacterized protein isoform X3 n=1 Tax=Triticum aestivum TaxID=4565 RepID=UPI001D035636|nr:uncharacterized protein LOC123166367 isoform X3 [Triticum aestivum]